MFVSGTGQFGRAQRLACPSPPPLLSSDIMAVAYGDSRSWHASGVPDEREDRIPGAAAFKVVTFSAVVHV
jgi:hypothetical protein